MAKKSGFKQKLLLKGEKYALFGALGLFVLFVLWGAISVSTAEDPKAKTNELKQKADGIDRAMKSDMTDLPDLPQALATGDGGGDFKSIPVQQFYHVQPPFEAVEWPSMRRENPRILAPVEGQINYFQGSVKVLARNFNGKEPLFGLLDKPFTPKDPGDLRKLQELFRKSLPTRGTRKGTQGGSDQPPMPMGNPMGNPMPPMPTGGGTTSSDSIIVWKTADEAAKLSLPPAIVVRPIRMNVIQASFPLKEQLQEIRRALRLQTLADAVMESGPNVLNQTLGKEGGKEGAIAPRPMPPMPMIGPGGKGADAMGAAAYQSAAGLAPVFEGIEVQRRVTTPGGTAGKWEALDHEGNFWDEFVRYKAQYLQESGHILYFLRPEQRLSSPLPVLADGLDPNYPPSTNLPTIYTNYNSLKEKDLATKPADEIRKRFLQGSNNPYAPSDSELDSFAPGFKQVEVNRPPVGIAGIIPPRPMRPDSPDQPVDPNATVDPNKLDVEYLLVRFVDSHLLQPGHTYEYRVRVRVRNPNYMLKDNVARNTDALVKELEGPWFEIPQKLTVPGENHLYAGDSAAFEKAVNKLVSDTESKTIAELQDLSHFATGRRAVVQMQQWFQSIVLPGGGQEQLGSWVVVDMPVVPGEYIGRRTFLRLPTWSPGIGNFSFRTVGDDLKKVLGWINSKPESIPRGFYMHDFRTRHLLIDFSGGKSKQTVGSSQVTDEAAAELLILREDGKIEVKSEIADQADKERRERAELWNKWLKEVIDRTDLEKSNEPKGRDPGRDPVRGGS